MKGVTGRAWLLVAGVLGASLLAPVASAGSATPRAAAEVTWELVATQCASTQLPAGLGCFDKPADGTGAWAAGAQSTTWKYPDSGGGQWTVIYNYPVPASIPSAGMKMTLSLTSTDPSTGPGAGVDGQVCIGGLSTFTVQESNNCASAYAMHPGDSKSASADVTLIPPNGAAGSEAFLVIDMGDGHQVHFTYRAQGVQPPPKSEQQLIDECVARVVGHSAADPTASAAAINEVHVVNVQPDAQFHKGGSPADAWLPLEKDTVLKAGDEITTDPDGAVTLAFADNSTVVVRNTTQLKIGSFFTEGGVVRTEILLKMGEVAACINKSEATKSDFRIKSPTGVSSVRGARDFATSDRRASVSAATRIGEALTAFYDPGSRTTLFASILGTLTIAGPHGNPLRIAPGHEVQLTPSSVGPVAAIGKAGARGGADIRKARDLVIAKIDESNRACRTYTPRSNAFAIAPIKNGWLVTVKLIGRLHGGSLWTVIGGRVAASNGLSKTLVRSCR